MVERRPRASLWFAMKQFHSKSGSGRTKLNLWQQSELPSQLRNHTLAWGWGRVSSPQRAISHLTSKEWRKLLRVALVGTLLQLRSETWEKMRQKVTSKRPLSLRARKSRRRMIKALRWQKVRQRNSFSISQKINVTSKLTSHHRNEKVRVSKVQGNTEALRMISGSKNWRLGKLMRIWNT